MENLRVPRSLLLLLGLGLGLGLVLWPGSVDCRPGVQGMELQSHYLKAVTAYRRLERILPRHELRALTGIGVLNGARQAEEQMEQNLVEAVRELVHQTNLTESNIVLAKIDAIEQQLSRDQRALDILARVMDVMARAKDDHEFRLELKEMAQQQKAEEQHQQELSADITDQPRLGERLGQLRLNILRQVPQMKTELEAKIEGALQHLLETASDDGVLAKAKQKVIRKRQVKKENDTELEEQQQQQMPQEMRIIKSILSEAHDLRFQDDFQENMLEQRSPRQLKIEAVDPPELEDEEVTSKDPEEEGPPQPLTFTKNLITSFLEANFRPNSEEGSEERHGSAELPRPRKKKEGGGWAAAAASHFDSGGFVKQVASHLVSNALGLILNAGLGASGGASGAVKGILASSSSGHHAKPADHHRSWSPHTDDFEPF
ncbi:probable inactive protein kinase DDB_G0270444 isoform X4 [Drosophila kikkawai]|uniref:Probable inactive protein kinase DDB_G0270444 isoform X4 n=1 Tax=Drosophila kikkawai TaxID=30033 RepID=A0ABM4GPQ7_DROKI